jgi:hypothetical protein
VQHHIIGTFEECALSSFVQPGHLRCFAYSCGIPGRKSEDVWMVFPLESKIEKKLEHRQLSTNPIGFSEQALGSISHNRKTESENQKQRRSLRRASYNTVQHLSSPLKNRAQFFTIRRWKRYKKCAWYPRPPRSRKRSGTSSRLADVLPFGP